MQPTEEPTAPSLQLTAEPTSRPSAPATAAGTLAGLTVGMRLAGLDTTIVGVRVVPVDWMSVERIHSLCAATGALLGVEPGHWELQDQWLGAGYSASTQASEQASARAADVSLHLVRLAIQASLTITGEVDYRLSEGFARDRTYVDRHTDNRLFSFDDSDSLAQLSCLDSRPLTCRAGTDNKHVLVVFNHLAKVLTAP